MENPTIQNPVYNLGQKVRISISDEVGIVNGYAVYTSSAPQYRVFYKAADGRACEGWWYEDQIAEF